jgi:hypothetical protein
MTSPQKIALNSGEEVLDGKDPNGSALLVRRRRRAVGTRSSPKASGSRSGSANFPSRYVPSLSRADEPGDPHWIGRAPFQACYGTLLRTRLATRLNRRAGLSDHCAKAVAGRCLFRGSWSSPLSGWAEIDSVHLRLESGRSARPGRMSVIGPFETFAGSATRTVQHRVPSRRSWLRPVISAMQRNDGSSMRCRSQSTRERGGRGHCVRSDAAGWGR